MKTICTFFSCFFLLVLISCSKDDSPAEKPIENPWDGLVEASGFLNSQGITGAISEYGMAFSAETAGHIEAITLRLPQPQSNVRVTLWDYQAQQVLTTYEVDVNDAGQTVIHEIEAFPVQADKKYVLTVNAASFFKYSGPAGHAAQYPIEVGGIVFYEYRWAGGSNQQFPYNSETSYIGGDIGFVFRPD